MLGRLLACAPALAALLVSASVPAAQPDAAPGFREGDVIGFDQLEKLRPFLPEEIWDNRNFFFYEGMQLEVGPTQHDYSPSAEWIEMTERFRGQAKIGPDNSLENWGTGYPFPQDEIDCLGDPQAGVKIMWDFRAPNGDGEAHFLYTYWDRGEQLPLYYEGTSASVRLAHRYEKKYEKSGFDIFPGEKRKYAFGAEVVAPFDARGIQLLTYRYKSSDRPRAEARNDDTWVYLPSLRRMRRISTAQRTDAISGTDFTLDDLRSFNGIVPQYEWTCLAERRIIAPMNTKVKGYPYDHKDIYLDRQTLQPLYSFAYDRKGELWKIIWHNHRWSEDESLTGEWFRGWDGVPEPRSLVVVSDIITNVQTGTGNRIEFWDAHGTPMSSKGKIRSYIDFGRLNRGR
jgi:hypothetical protein